MSRDRFLPAEGLTRLVSSLLDEGVTVCGPARAARGWEYRRIGTPEMLDLQGDLPALPLKAIFLPPTETLFTWRRAHNDVTLEPVAGTPPTTVVVGARPCDAAGVAVLDKVMGWDYRDEPWFARREATTIVTLACEAPRPGCFCDAVGLGPASPKGSDVLLTPRAGGFDAEAFSEKGEALIARIAVPPAGSADPPARPAETAAGSREAGTDPVGPLDLPRIQNWLAAHFDDPLWARLGLRCHGCGACASVCPTCHCFDIVDEPDGLLAGSRRRNWDACQSARFTVHASGHNPRADQGARFRQRVIHKFSVYPQKFGEVLCTGCGRCSAACPAGQNLAEVLHEVAES